MILHCGICLIFAKIFAIWNPPCTTSCTHYCHQWRSIIYQHLFPFMEQNHARNLEPSASTTATYKAPHTPCFIMKEEMMTRVREIESFLSECSGNKMNNEWSILHCVL
eukprot:127415_1